YILQVFLLCLSVVALVSAVPVDETQQGDNVYSQSDVHNPHDPQAIFKLKKIKKLLLG
ncbi:hypothetical protein KR044_009019, partial [Drosophila immigrans]